MVGMMKSPFATYVFSSNCFFGLGGNGGGQKTRDLDAKLVWKEANCRGQGALSVPSENLKSSGWGKGRGRKSRELTEGQKGILGATNAAS